MVFDHIHIAPMCNSVIITNANKTSNGSSIFYGEKLPVVIILVVPTQNPIRSSIDKDKR